MARETAGSAGNTRYRHERRREKHGRWKVFDRGDCDAEPKSLPMPDQPSELLRALLVEVGDRAQRSGR